MTKGARAVWLAIGLIVVSAILAYLLNDGSIFTSTSVTSLLGKFGYDGVRDVSQNRTNGAPSSIEEYGD